MQQNQGDFFFNAFCFLVKEGTNITHNATELLRVCLGFGCVMLVTQFFLTPHLQKIYTYATVPSHRPKPKSVHILTVVPFRAMLQLCL